MKKEILNQLLLFSRQNVQKSRTLIIVQSSRLRTIGEAHRLDVRGGEVVSPQTSLYTNALSSYQMRGYDLTMTVCKSL